jgi:glycosyltransferase involved in cell wall biosynthesis
MMKSVSVILPVYNVAEHIENALRCLKRQTYGNLEIILVDDGSTDGQSGSLCDQIAQREGNVTAYHKVNGGLSSARNFGLEKAKGEFIYFFDPDDAIEDDLIERAVGAAERYNSDYVVFGYSMELYAAGRCTARQVYCVPEARILRSHQEIIDNLVDLSDRSLIYNAWNKLYRHKILTDHNLKYSGVPIGEDWDFNLHYIEYCGSAVILSDCLYHYVRERSGNLSTTFRKNWYDLRLEEYRRIGAMYRLLGADGDQCRDFLARQHAERVLGCVENEFSGMNAINAREKKRRIRRIITEPDTKAAFGRMRSTSLKVKILSMPIRKGNAELTYVMGYCLAVVRRSFPRLFFRLKASR